MLHPGRYLALDEVVELMNGWIKKRVRVSKCKNRITFLSEKYNLLLRVEDSWKTLFTSGVPRRHRENVCSVKETEAIMATVVKMCTGQILSLKDLPCYARTVSDAEFAELVRKAKL
jgi:hypothetical protein